MNINFYWVFFFIALVLFAAIGFGLSSLVRDRPFTVLRRTTDKARERGPTVTHRGRRHAAGE